MYRTTALIGTSKQGWATRLRSFQKPTMAKSGQLLTVRCCKKVCQLANGLRARGIKKGDRVIIYMAMGIEGIVAMQACARPARFTRWSSAAFRRNRYATGLTTLAPWPLLPPTSSIIRVTVVINSVRKISGEAPFRHAAQQAFD